MQTKIYFMFTASVTAGGRYFLSVCMSANRIESYGWTVTKVD